MPTTQQMQIKELKDRVQALEQALALMADLLHQQFKGDLMLGPQATRNILQKVKAMRGSSGVL